MLNPAIMTVLQKATRFAVLKSQIEWHEKQITQLKGLMDNLSEVIYDEMLEDGIGEVRIEPKRIDPKTKASVAVFRDGRARIIKPSEKYKAHIKNEAKDDAFLWFRKNGHGSLIQEVINANTLNSWVTERKEKNEEVPPPELVSVFLVKGAKISLARK